jgi:AraC-like DNA-binding protein
MYNSEKGLMEDYMGSRFEAPLTHSVTMANINYYSVPFTHPTRRMCEHDFIYMLDGEWTMQQNGREYTQRKDTVLILAAGNLHGGVTPCTAGAKTMYFHVQRLPGDEAESGAEGLPTYVDASLNPNIKALFSRVVDLKLAGEQRRADLFFELLLTELSRAVSESAESDVAVHIRNAIHRYPERFFTNRELADSANVSVKTAETKFKAAFGVTIHKYITDFKIRKAVWYLDTADKISVKNVAYNLGFYDEYHFSNVFKQVMGVSPLAYRRGKRAE